MAHTHRAMHKTALQLALGSLALAAVVIAFRAYLNPGLLLNLLAMSFLC